MSQTWRSIQKTLKKKKVLTNSGILLHQGHLCRSATESPIKKDFKAHQTARTRHIDRQILRKLTLTRKCPKLSLLMAVRAQEETALLLMKYPQQETGHRHRRAFLVHPSKWCSYYLIRYSPPSPPQIGACFREEKQRVKKYLMKYT